MANGRKKLKKRSLNLLARTKKIPKETMDKLVRNRKKTK